ncbi:grasp-with-spasm system A modified peptide [uncultured Chryseobacterium sp.]|uniref:grasp-with-spasm system A modified peptide n=1 Tax=uncultured Chryseobacterium sp. TaxID=259322 RepID=UPI0025D96E5A|nr:grasp-with-spasm system A modified peptide [uncultured Chryseobacterium sp.]
MKKLNGLKKGFSSLENKKLSNPSLIVGSGASNDTWTTNSSPNETADGCPDVKTWKDGVLQFETSV